MFSATDVANFLACQHTAKLALAQSRGEIKKPVFHDPSLELLQQLGFEHEKRYLDFLSGKGKTVTSIKFDSQWEGSVADTIAAIRRGDAAIYQASFKDGEWRGRADFLIRVDLPSALGPWSYEVVDTKLARSTKAGAVLQLCFYSDLLSRIQGIEPLSMRVVLGAGFEAEIFPVQRYIAYYRRIRNEYEAYFASSPGTYPEPNDHCKVCSWSPVCDKQRHQDDHLSLIAGASRNQRKALASRGIATMLSFAQTTVPLTPPVERIGKAALVRIHQQAKIQIKGREENCTCYELIEHKNPGEGLSGLPEPSPGDIFLDLEANPYVLEDGLEYLIGSLTIAHGGEPSYTPYWSFNRAQEKASFEQFIAEVLARRAEFPGMHVYHYAPYEPTALKRLAGRHATCVDELDDLLRTHAFVDLFRVFRQGVRASVESYSIKRIEPLYQFQRSIPLREANLALNSYEALLAMGTQHAGIDAFQKTIEGYNRDDCSSTWKLRQWLEDRRPDWQRKFNVKLTRPTPEETRLEIAAGIDEVAELKRRLTETLTGDEQTWSDPQRACWLLAQMIDWHRREDKSMWWEYFRLLELTDDELQEDKNALGGLVYQGPRGVEKKSTIHRYSYPPQDHAIKLSSQVRDPKTEKSPGEIVAVDELHHTIDLKRSTNSTKQHPTSLIVHKYIDKEDQEECLRSLAAWVADNSIDAAGEHQAARSLLLRQPPPIPAGMGLPIAENGLLTETTKALLHSLATTPAVLPIQGPPGSGKTFTGAKMIVELAKQGRRIGVSAVSHKVIAGLLRQTCEKALEESTSLRIIQKIKDEDEACDHACVKITTDNAEVLDSLQAGKCQVAAGTAWLWCRPEMANSVDVLFVDEAGQMSLANTLAIAQAATSLVLLGDPQQLDQPQRGVHPPGADVSALGHLLNGHKTIAAEQGIFLAQTRRLHPDICDFTSEIFYEGRLVPRPENSRQRLSVASAALGGTGLRFAAVEHQGNQSESPEEVERVKLIVSSLLTNGNAWTDKDGATHPLSIKDILIVAPYNAQVDALIEALPLGAEIGTVDKFQGRQAPVVIYSMATSTPDDAPRGMEFLYSMNRLNVATSRAQCVAVIVASPALFRVQCRTPRQIELANSFARYLEMAEAI